LAAPTSCPDDSEVDDAARRWSKASGRLAILSLSLSLMTLGYAPGISSAQEIQRITAAGQAEMLADPGTDVVGATDADVTIVEFLDFNCPYCKRFAPTLQSLLAEDHRIAVVYKDWPILGDVSVYAARSALAARSAQASTLVRSRWLRPVMPRTSTRCWRVMMRKHMHCTFEAHQALSSAGSCCRASLI
jgi:protein-disulfide isomerase